MTKPDHAAEAIRRRDRVQTGRSPAQKTKRSRNKARCAKYPGKGQRQDWRKEVA